MRESVLSCTRWCAARPMGALGRLEIEFAASLASADEWPFLGTGDGRAGAKALMARFRGAGRHTEASSRAQPSPVVAVPCHACMPALHDSAAGAREIRHLTRAPAALPRWPLQPGRRLLPLACLLTLFARRRARPPPPRKGPGRRCHHRDDGLRRPPPAPGWVHRIASHRAADSQRASRPRRIAVMGARPHCSDVTAAAYLLADR